MSTGFFGVDGFDTKNGIFTPNVEEARLNEIMLRSQRKSSYWLIHPNLKKEVSHSFAPLTG